jgi:alkylated DNA repair dioxygenase AlkB
MPGSDLGDDIQVCSAPPLDIKLIEGTGWGLSTPDILAQLIAEIPWRQEHIVLFGKTYLQPRLLCWMGDPECSYRYSGTSHAPEPWHELVSALRIGVEQLAGTSFNSVLLNYYRNGGEGMGFHADDEPELGERPTIASLSFGATRVMHFRHRQAKEVPAQRIGLHDGSLLIMGPMVQRDWKHAIPKTRKPIGPRVNLTFRRIVR